MQVFSIGKRGVWESSIRHGMHDDCSITWSNIKFDEHDPTWSTYGLTCVSWFWGSTQLWPASVASGLKRTSTSSEAGAIFHCGWGRFQVQTSMPSLLDLQQGV